MRTTCFLRYALLVVMTFFWRIPMQAQSTDTLWLQKIDLKRFTQDWTLTPKAFLALDKNPLILAKQSFKNGLASRTEAVLKFDLDGKAQHFHSLFGVDDASNKKAQVVLTALADNKEVFRSPLMTAGSKPIEVNINLKGVKQLSLILDDGGTGLYLDRANYANAFISYNGATPAAFNFNYINKRHILTPPTSPKPKINGARVFGVRPGRPFIFTVAATGDRPMTFNAINLPKGLSLDPQTGIIKGVLTKKGESLVTLNAKNKLGTSTRILKIVVGEKIALTPPMGWNEYNRYGDKINQATMKASVDAMVSSGLINHGWTYINIDDGWSIKPSSNEPMNWGEPRDANGMINANKKFPDMKELTDYIHAKGFKAGIYSSPGPLTCSRYTGSYQFEQEDAQRWANWGFDYLKYDYCTYGDLFPSHDLDTLQKPYIIMRKALDNVDRDIVFNFSQYGIGDSWKWAGKIGGNSWRTTGDLIDTWESLNEIGFSQAGKEQFAGPGQWNDPDMLAVGYVGWGEVQYPSRLTADEQFTHVSLWSLLAAPLLIGCDIIAMDDFTKSLFTNDEVIEINQDPLGKQASRSFQQDGLEIWAKEMEDGSKAVGLFNRNETTQTIKATWNTLGISGKHIVRDVWRQHDEGNFIDSFSAVVPAHGVKLITFRKIKNASF